MIELARSSALHALNRAAGLLAIARETGATEARLTEDMFDFADQVRVTAGFAMRAVLPVLGQPVPEIPEEMDPVAALDLALEAVTVAAGAPVAEIAHRAGFADIVQDPEDYVARFALPNLWFHLSMAYAILRARGVAVGKADFDGMHEYPEGFRWSR